MWAFQNKASFVELPCNVGDTVYFHHIIGKNKDGSPVEEVREGIVDKIEIDNQIWIGVSFGWWCCCRPYTDFFLTKEEAEQKLKGGMQE